MSLCRYFGLGLRPCLNVYSQCKTMKRVLEVRHVYGGATCILRNRSTNLEGENCQIVYVGPLTKQVRSVKLFSLLSSFTGVFAQPVIYEKAQEVGVSTPMLVAVCSIVGFFTFITPLLLHFVTKKYVTSITYNKRDDSYTATVYTLFTRKREISFLPGEAIVPDVLGLFTSMTVRGIPLFVDARFFEDLTHYKRIMGYDKPIDFKTGNPQHQDSAE